MNTNHQIQKQLNSFSKVHDYLLLDAGKHLYIVLATSGQYSSYTPTNGFTALTKEQAEALADRYWHLNNLPILPH